MDAVTPTGGLQSLRDLLNDRATAAERVGDPSAPFLRGLVLRCDIERQRDDRVEEMLSTAESIAGGSIASRASQELPAAIDRMVKQRVWRYNLLIALGALLVAAAAGLWGQYQRALGFSDGRGSRIAEVQHAVDAIPAAAVNHGGPRAAEMWLTIMQNNDITKAERSCEVQLGQTVCSIALWMGTPPPAQQALQANQPTTPPAAGKASIKKGVN